MGVTDAHIGALGCTAGPDFFAWPPSPGLATTECPSGCGLYLDALASLAKSVKIE